MATFAQKLAEAQWKLVRDEKMRLQLLFDTRGREQTEAAQKKSMEEFYGPLLGGRRSLAEGMAAAFAAAGKANAARAGYAAGEVHPASCARCYGVTTGDAKECIENKIRAGSGPLYLVTSLPCLKCVETLARAGITRVAFTDFDAGANEVLTELRRWHISYTHVARFEIAHGLAVAEWMADPNAPMWHPTFAAIPGCCPPTDPGLSMPLDFDAKLYK